MLGSLLCSQEERQDPGLGAPAVISQCSTSISLLPWLIRNKERLAQERSNSLGFPTSEKRSERAV